MSYKLKEASYSKSFFERLGSESEVERSIVDEASIDLVIDSIKYNLSNILNSRAGQAQSAPDLGLLDFNDATITTDDVALQIKQAISDCILRYEPRVSAAHVTIHSDPDRPMDLNIRALVEVDVNNRKHKIAIDMFYDNNQRYKIS